MTLAMRTTWNSFANSRLLFGPGSLDLLGQVVGQFQAKRVMIFSDPILESLGVLKRAAKLITGKTYIFSDGEAEPSTDMVRKCIALHQDFKPDVVVAIGGGSNMDLAKMTCAAVSSGKEPESLFGFDQIPGPIGPLICIPTTAGTGSESSASAVVLNSCDGKKAAALSSRLRPEVAIIDPELALTCPPKLTAESGIDALTHAIEAYLAVEFYRLKEFESGPRPYEGNHPLGDLYAEKAIRLVGKHLIEATKNPQNIEARAGMALAANLGGLAFSNCGVTLAHALEYPIGSRYECSHGIGNGIVLPGVMRYMRPVRESRIAKIGEFLGVTDSADEAINEVIRLREECGLPDCLSAVGAKREDLPSLAATAFSLKRLMELSPAEVSESDLLDILKESF